MNSLARLGFSSVALLAATTQSYGQSVDPALVGAYFDRLGENGLSASVQVVQNGEVILRKSYGLAQDDPATAMTPQTLNDIGSLAKQFTSALVLMKVEEGLIGLDDPVSKFFPGAPADKQAITLHQLLTHTSGLTEHSGDDFAPMTRDAALNNIFSSALAFKPGESFTYSNSGYTLLAAIIEEASGESYADLVRKKLWRENGLRDTAFHGDPILQKRPVASGYVNGEAQPSPVRDMPVQWGVLGNGGVLSTTDDMTRWMRRLSAGKVLSRKSLETLWSAHVERNGGEAYAYGWRVYDSPVGRGVWHGGTGAGGNADVAYFPDAGLLSIILGNRIELISDAESGQYVKITLPAREARIGLTRAIAENDPTVTPVATLDRSGDAQP